MRDYLQEKREENRRKKGKKLRVIIGIVLVIILISGVIWLLRGSWYTVQSVSVEQLDSVLSQEVASTTDSYIHTRSFLASIFLNANSFLGFGGNSLEQEISRTYPVLTDITVSKNYFTRVITIQARERAKTALWCDSQNSCWWFDDDGVVFLEAPVTQGQLLKKVISSSNTPITIGQHIPLDSSVLNSIFSFLDAIHAPGKSLLWNPALEEITTEARKGFPTIYFSTRQDPSYALPSIEKISNLQNISYIDLRVTNRIYYR